MINDSLRLLDKYDNEIAFDSGGRFTGIWGVKEKVIRSITIGKHKVLFKYVLNSRGHIVINSAWIYKDAKCFFASL